MFEELSYRYESCYSHSIANFVYIGKKSLQFLRLFYLTIMIELETHDKAANDII